MAIFELSSKKYKNGRRPFTATLYELQPPECVVDDVGTKYNKNGITFLEEYASKALDSIKDMSVRVEFLNDERTEIWGHGETGVEDGLPLFNNATTVGHFTEGYIADVELNNETKRCVCGKGYLDEMAYHPFISTLEEKLQNGNSIEGSVEIYRTSENDEIVYKKGWLEKGRIPTKYIHSGWDMVINPADSSSTLLELNNSKNNKEDKLLDEKELKELIQSTILETNSKNEEFSNKIKELNSLVTEKEATIVELNTSIETLKSTLDKLNADHETYWAERELLEHELVKAKVAEKISELDSSFAEFNEAEKEIAKDDIEELKKNINACEKRDELNNVTNEINSIKSKICMDIVAKQKAADSATKVSEQNTANKKVDIEDIFSEVCTEEETDDSDVNIF